MGLSGVAHLALGITVAFAVGYPGPPDSLLMKPFDPAEYQVKILTGPYLPQIEDASGAETGTQGKAGGREAYHPQQVIRVYRGPAETEKVIDAPKLRLPMTTEAIANVIVVPRVAPTVPVTARPELAKGFEQLAPEAVPPVPDVQRIQARQKFDLLAEVVPPTPELDSRLPVRSDLQSPEVVAPTVNADGLELAARTVDVPLLEVARPVAASNTPHPARADQDWGAGASASGSPEGGSIDGALVLSPAGGNMVGTSASQPGALAMSPKGSGTIGLGGSGGGTGTGIGRGPGSGATGSGPGSGRTGAGRGSSTVARGGLMAGPGPGGTGTGARAGAIPGVTIRGGNVSLPSFAAPQPGDSGPVIDPRNRPPLTIVATPRSGGALALYGQFAGARVYTIYIDTSVGMAVMQYSQVAQQGERFDVDLTAPEPLHFPVPEKVATRILVSCTLGTDGKLKDVKIVEGASSKAAAPLTAALADWIFRPVMRGDTPIPVHAVLGFSIDTR
jgi:hypothetical protein